jgi:hypothetical protein
MHFRPLDHRLNTLGGNLPSISPRVSNCFSSLFSFLSLGEFATVAGDIAANNIPQAADFYATSFTVLDLNGSPISGLAVTFTVNNQ